MGTRIVWFALCLAAGGCASHAEHAEQPVDRSNEAKYAVSHCLARAYPGSEVADSARHSAGAYLEKGQAGFDVHEHISAFVDDYRATPYLSKHNHDLRVMQCLDLFDSNELSDLL